MLIEFASKSIEELCNDSRKRLKRCGAARAKLLQRRLDDLRAAANLETMRVLPGRCHEHKNTTPPTLTVDLDGPNRLYFEAADEPIPFKPDGGLDWAKTTRIRITKIDDPHGT